MLKKITSILVAGAMVTAMAISAGAENYDKKNRLSIFFGINYESKQLFL